MADDAETCLSIEHACSCRQKSRFCSKTRVIRRDLEIIFPSGQEVFDSGRARVVWWTGLRFPHVPARFLCPSKLGSCARAQPLGVVPKQQPSPLSLPARPPAPRETHFQNGPHLQEPESERYNGLCQNSDTILTNCCEITQTRPKFAFCLQVGPRNECPACRPPGSRLMFIN